MIILSLCTSLTPMYPQRELVTSQNGFHLKGRQSPCPGQGYRCLTPREELFRCESNADGASQFYPYFNSQLVNSRYLLGHISLRHFVTADQEAFSIVVFNTCITFEIFLSAFVTSRIQFMVNTTFETEKFRVLELIHRHNTTLHLELSRFLNLTMKVKLTNFALHIILSASYKLLEFCFYPQNDHRGS